MIDKTKSLFLVRLVFDLLTDKLLYLNKKIGLAYA